jgi:hypothetical protein
MAIGNQLIVDRTLNECLQNNFYWHYYQTYLQAGQRVVIRQQSAFFDTYMCAKANTATAWDCNDDVSTTDSNSELTLTAQSNGYYDVAVSSFNSFATGTYRLAIASTPVYISAHTNEQDAVPVPAPVVGAMIPRPQPKPIR